MQGEKCCKKRLGRHNIRSVHSNNQEIRQKCWEARMKDQGTSGQTKTQKGSIQRVEARMGNMGRMQKHCLSIQG